VDTGLIEDRYEYDAFGTPYQGDFSGGMNLGYTGKPYDPATGLYNYGFRDYAPQVARFTTVDPIRDGNNWFAYVNNDPVNWVDPWGLSASDKKSSFWDTVKDIGGKIIAAPVTAIGLVAGAALVGISKITGNGGSISIQNNAITFTTGLNLNGSITLGNAIIHANGDAKTMQ
jgi:RHS repeat-associated protein